MKRTVFVLMIAVMMLLPHYAFSFHIKTEYEVRMQDLKNDRGATIDANRDFAYKKSPLNKLGRGAINLVTCWAEVPAQFFKVSAATPDDNTVAGALVGFPQGALIGLVRGATAIYDICTFPIPPYDKPVMKPEYAIQHADAETDNYMGGMPSVVNE